MKKRTKTTLKASKPALMEKLELPSIKVESGTTLTIFEVGNEQIGLWPSQADLEKIRDLVKEAIETKNSSIFVPAGTVRIRQILL